MLNSGAAKLDCRYIDKATICILFLKVYDIASADQVFSSSRFFSRISFRAIVQCLEFYSAKGFWPQLQYKIIYL
ncbi:hypothetical protein XELAEV_18042791mg [Xenopus laevis]|uniref:Uncharacterized protein n=1 Tax=Xenopus laevis TaxID=8355 RepID=A0A974H6W0_XENLA|nr:hypothetical protein XELAEV_18042791mg [Xenopus laevis]